MLRRIGIAINSKCNAKCVMCDIGQKDTSGQYYRHVENRDEICLATFKRVISQMWQALAINGTEPLLHKDVVEMVSMYKGCSLTTNGLLLEDAAKGLAEAGLRQLYVSVDGVGTVHDRVRGVPGIFDAAVRGIDATLSHWKRPKVGVAFAVNDLNCDHLLDTGRYFRKLGVDGFSISHLNYVSPSMAAAHNEMDVEGLGAARHSCTAVNTDTIDSARIYQQIDALKREYGGWVTFAPNLRTRAEVDCYYNTDGFVRPSVCKAAWRNMQILPNGAVIPAARCFGPVMGNVTWSSLADIWHGFKYKAFRKRMKRIKHTPACARCCSLTLK